MGQERIISKLQKNKSLLWLPSISWLFLYIWGLVITNFALVPWDTSINLPLFETWQSSLNHFFDTWPGSHIPSITVVSISTCLFLVKVNNQKKDQFVTLIAEFSFTNFLFIFLSLPILLVSTVLRDLWFELINSEISSGYYRTWPHILISAITISLLLFSQWYGISNSFLGKKLVGWLDN